jgi:hypothetical protein
MWIDVMVATRRAGATENGRIGWDVAGSDGTWKRIAEKG